MAARDTLIGLLHSSGFKSTKSMRAQFEEVIREVDISIVNSIQEFTKNMFRDLLVEMRANVKEVVAEELRRPSQNVNKISQGTETTSQTTMMDAETQCDQPRRRRTRWGPPLTVVTQEGPNKPKDEEGNTQECQQKRRRKKTRNQPKSEENKLLCKGRLTTEPQQPRLDNNNLQKIHSCVVVVQPTYSEVLKKNLKIEETKTVQPLRFTPEEIRQRELEWMEDMEVFPTEVHEEEEDWTSDLERPMLQYDSPTLETVRIEVTNVPRSWDIRQLKDNLYHYNFRSVVSRTIFDRNFCRSAKMNFFSSTWVLDIHPRFAVRLYTQKKVFIGIGRDVNVQPLWDAKVADLFIKAGWNGQHH